MNNQFFLVSHCVTSTSFATTCTVDDDGAADFNTIIDGENARRGASA